MSINLSVARQLFNLKGKAPAIIRVCIEMRNRRGHIIIVGLDDDWSWTTTHQSTEWRHGSWITHRAHPCKKQHPIQAEIFSRWWRDMITWQFASSHCHGRGRR
jgi:hypothetical protein